MSDLTKMLADNQKEMSKLIAPMTKKSSDYQALENSDSEPENISVVRTSTPVKTKATTSKTTPINTRNKLYKPHRMAYKVSSSIKTENHFQENRKPFFHILFQTCGLLGSK